MSHKITLTGNPTSELRSVGDIFNFDMTQTTNNIAKGLPMPENPIVYTVFINKKQKDKLSISKKEEFPTLKLLVQGEPTLDVPVANCPGEIGVLCKQIERIPNKNKKEEEQITAEKEVQAAYKEVATTAATVNGLIGITQIVIPEQFQQTPPNPFKVAEKKEIIQKLGDIEKPIVLSQKNVLLDGYSWYIAALELDIHEVPVEYKCMDTYELMDINQIVIPEQFEKVRPNPSKLEKKKKSIQQSGKFEKPILLSNENILRDGYNSYIAALELGIREVPVVFKKIRINPRN